MVSQNKPKWYFENWSLVGSFLCVGPFMLPLIWANPRFSKNSKMIITVVVIVITFIISVFIAKFVKNIISYYQIAFRDLK